MHDTFLTRKVRRTYRKHMLAQICTMPEESFGRAFSMATVEVPGPAGADYYHFRDNGASVLAVAHLDTVVARNHRAPHFYSTARGPAIRSGALDDRLGAYIILGMLPRLGISTDVLLTVGEEWGESTATYFKPSKDYDWVIEFDRMGTDVVMYQYEDEPSCRAVEQAGAPVGWGSFSDIAYLEHLGVKAFNWGAGYAGNYHSIAGFAYLNDTFSMVGKYMRFHKRNAGITMTHVPTVKRYASRYGEQLECWFCEARNTISPAGHCEACDSCQDCGQPEKVCQCWTPASKDDESLDDSLTGARAVWEASS